MQELKDKLVVLRKNNNWTQDELAEKLNVSSQAVSKWENGISIPDIQILKQLSNLYNVSLDVLLKDENDLVFLSDEKEDISKKILNINVLSSEKDKVSINLPCSVIKILTANGKKISNNKALETIDFDEIINLVSNGVCGKIIEVDSKDGDHVEINVK